MLEMSEQMREIIEGKREAIGLSEEPTVFLKGKMHYEYLLKKVINLCIALCNPAIPKQYVQYSTNTNVGLRGPYGYMGPSFKANTTFATFIHWLTKGRIAVGITLSTYVNR